MEMKNGEAAMKNTMCSSEKLKTELFYDSAILLLVIYLK